jgi:hypothetical protein
MLPIEIRELLIEPPDEPATSAWEPEAIALSTATDPARVVETVQRSEAVRADRLRAD